MASNITPMRDWAIVLEWLENSETMWDVKQLEKYIVRTHCYYCTAYQCQPIEKMKEHVSRLLCPIVTVTGANCDAEDSAYVLLQEYIRTGDEKVRLLAIEKAKVMVEIQKKYPPRG